MKKLEFDWNKNLSAPPVARRKTSSEEIRRRVHERIEQKTKPFKTIGTLLGGLITAAVALWIALPLANGLFNDYSNKAQKREVINEPGETGNKINSFTPAVNSENAVNNAFTNFEGNLDMTGTNSWSGRVRGQFTQVFAGALRNDNTQGMLDIMLEEGDSTKTYVSTPYPTPSKHGIVKIIGVNGEILDIQAADGTLFHFDLAQKIYLKYPDLMENPIQFDTPGPVQHIVWKRATSTDEWWQNTESGETRTVSTDTAKGIVQTTITEADGKNRILYLIVTENGRVTSAQKIPQLNNDGKSHRIIDDKKITDTSGYTFVQDYVLGGRPVTVLERNGGRFFVDKATKLPIAVLSTTSQNGEQFYTYSYLPNDPSLFKAPRDINYQDMPAVDATPAK